jgi:signal transduction histidine kinase
MTGQKSYGSWRDLIPLATVVTAGLALAVAAFMATRAYYAALEQQQFRRNATYFETKFKDDVARHVTSLAAIRAFVSATRGVTRWEFSAYAGQILPLNTGFRAVLWVPRVTQAGRRAYETDLQRDGLYGLRIHQFAGQGLVAAAEDRASYLPVSYVEPFEGNEALVGIDLSAVAALSQLFESAERTGHVAASAPTTHSIVTGARDPTIMLAFPVGLAGSKDAAGAVPQGFALGVLQLQAIIDDTLGTTAVPLEAALSVPPSASGAAPLFSANATAETWLADARLSHRTSIDIGGRHFQLLLRSTSPVDSATFLYVPAGAAMLVIALTALLAQSMFATVMRKRLVEQAVVARTAELRSANETLRGEIEQRRLAETELRVARDRAERANRAKTSFLSIMSHELRTPLNAIIGFSSLLTNNDCAAQHREEYAQEIMGGGQRLLAIVNDILDLTEMMSKPDRPDDGLVYLGDCIASVIAEMQPAARAAGISLKAVMPSDLPALRGDNRRISRALSHLVSNAIKFTSGGGTTLITARQDPDQSLVLEVADDGAGMTPETQEKIREAFSQSDSRLGRRHEGLGLGLTYVSRVAEFHHATFDLASEAGKGTRACLVFDPSLLCRALEVA